MSKQLPQKYILVPIERFNRLNAMVNRMADDKTTENAPKAPFSQITTLPNTVAAQADTQASNKDPNETTQEEVEQAIRHFPRRFKNKARLIASYFNRGRSPISINKAGEAVLGEKTLEGSSMSDLLYDVACPKRNYEPTGAKSFYEHLALNKVPQGLILNAQRRNWMKSVRGDEGNAADQELSAHLVSDKLELPKSEWLLY